MNETAELVILQGNTVPVDPYLLGMWAGTVIFLYLVISWITKDHKGRKMGRDTIKVSDIIEDALDKAVADGKISMRYKRYWTTRISKGADIPDLRPLTRLGKKISPSHAAYLKEQMKYRVKSWFPKLKRGEAVPLPADPPPTPTEAAQQKFKKFFKPSAVGSTKKAA